MMTTPKIGIIGAGNMGRIHARVLNSVRALVAVADQDLARAESEAKKYGVKAYKDYRTMLSEVDLDGVIISTPSSTHADIAKDIAKNFGNIKGVLIEKPLADTLEEAKKVAEALQDNGIIAVISHSEIYNPVLSRALSLIKSGDIGTPRSVIHDRRGFVQPERIPALGDVFVDIGVHDFDIMARISSGRARLYAQGNSEGGIFNAGTVMISFEDGTEHLFLLSRQYVGRRRNLDVSGTKGTLSLDLFAQIIKVQDLDQEPSADSRTIRLHEKGATIKVYGEPLGEVISDFLGCIESGEKPQVGLEDGIAALEIVEATRKSAKTGQVVEIEVRSRG
ncbi:MAG: Gfo/Idh/MocA family oxidoreductase [Candidatus Thorarchaeota archaeon]|nr:MAG: Gfo/Idh/MocA family oxidoreductase [Candidatus Thorarchaeota archaeon]